MKEHITYEDYASLPDDGNRYEIEDGVLQLMTPGPNTKHQDILYNLTEAFIANDCKHSGKFRFAPLDVIFAPDNVRQPDFVFVSNDRLDIISHRGIEGAPDLLGEILSPSTAKRDKINKKETYQRFGVKEYWIIDPHYELVEQHVLTDGVYRLHHVYDKEETIASPHISCIRIPVSHLFAE